MARGIEHVGCLQVVDGLPDVALLRVHERHLADLLRLLRRRLLMRRSRKYITCARCSRCAASQLVNALPVDTKIRPRPATLVDVTRTSVLLLSLALASTYSVPAKACSPDAKPDKSVSTYPTSRAHARDGRLRARIGPSHGASCARPTRTCSSSERSSPRTS
jgi:hypothetical protein